MTVDYHERCLLAQVAINELLSAEAQARDLLPDGTYRVRCNQCGISVSNPLPVAVVVRAWVECPDCMGRRLLPTAEETVQ